jgi:hypothetical protein
MHSSGFNHAVTDALMIEGTAGDRLWDWTCSPRTATIRPRPTDGRLAGRMTILGSFVTTFVPPSRPWKSEDALRQTELLSVGTVCADVSVPWTRKSAVTESRREQRRSSISKGRQQ